MNKSIKEVYPPSLQILVEQNTIKIKNGILINNELIKHINNKKVAKNDPITLYIF